MFGERTGTLASCCRFQGIFLENARRSSKTDREHLIQEELQSKNQYMRDIEMIFAAARWHPVATAMGKPLQPMPNR